MASTFSLLSARSCSFISLHDAMSTGFPGFPGFAGFDGFVDQKPDSSDFVHEFGGASDSREDDDFLLAASRPCGHASLVSYASSSETSMS